MTKKIKSIHSQLILLYSLAAVAVLLVIAMAFYWETQNVMRQADYNFVKEEAGNIRSILAEQIPDQHLLRKTVIDHPLRTRNSLYRYYVRVFDEQGRVEMETPGITDIITKPDLPRLESAVIKQYISSNYHGSNYLTYFTRTPQGYIQVALDRSYQHSITQDRRVFIGLVVLGLLMALMLGQYVTNRGLKSLNILTATVKTITTSSLNQRVDPRLLPRELAPLCEAFNQMLDRIELSFDRLHQMSADMSHELRTPITNMIGQTEVLLSYPHSEADCHNAMASNLEELQRMASLVENILFLARAESRLPAIEYQRVEAQSEIAKVCEYYEALAADKNISFVQEGAADLRANTVLFRRLMNNLVSNAVKYSPDNATINITVNDHGDTAVIRVSDNGIGIPQQHLPRLFDRFYRVDDSRSTEIAGTGLGLAIVKSIVDLHQGMITVKSMPVQGTTCEVVLPKVFPPVRA
jgi:two-component system, OmpR family, heavy metal sensor histidine kinase CusS